MKLATAALALTLLFAAAARGESVSIKYDATVSIDSPGATAAYSINSTIAEATAVDGVVRIHGLAEGATSVVVVTADGTTTINIVVLPPPIVIPAVLNAMQDGRGDFGIFETRASSDPRMWFNSIDMRRESGGRVERFRLGASNYFDDSYETRFGLPVITYQVAQNGREIVIGDKGQAQSPLTITGTQIRGVHLTDGTWTAIAGYASFAAFQTSIFTTDPEYVAAVSRRIRLRSGDSLFLNLDYFKNPASVGDVKDGVVASAMLRRTRETGLSYLAEAALAPGAIGLAGAIEYNDERHHLAADFRYRPNGLPSLALDAQHGLFANFGYGATMSRRLNFALSAVGSEYDLPQMKQRNSTINQRIVFQASNRLSLYGGTVYSDFAAGGTSPVQVRTLAVPGGVGLAFRYGDFGVDYQPTWDLRNGRRSDGAGARAGFRAGDLRVNAAFRRDVQLPGLANFLSSVPGLQDALERSGIYVTNVNQVIQYLRDTAFLISLGFASDLRFNVTPVRTSLTLNADYVQARQRFTLNVLDSRSQEIVFDSRFRTASLAYVRQLLAADEISLSLSFSDISGDRNTTTATQVAASYRHRFTEVPQLTYRRHGTISGHVFVDEAGEGMWGPGMRGIVGANVTLDDTRTVQTDANGFYEFEDVPARPHRISVNVPSILPFTFTGDSPRTVEINKTADFGIAYLKGKLFGRIANDAGAGIPGVVLRLQGLGGTLTTQSGDNGDFSFSNLPDGAFWLSVSPDSFPLGYDLLSLSEDPIVVRNAAPVEFNVFARALRSISGVVNALDSTGVSAPVPDVQVAIPQLSRVTHTNTSGRFRFIDVPAGSYTLEVQTPAGRFTREVDVPAAPVNVTNANLTIVRK